MMIKKVSPDKLVVAANQNIKEEEFWRNKLAGDLVKSNFPFDYKKSTPKECHMTDITFRFPKEIFSRLMTLSKGSDHTLNAILVSGLVVLLNKYTNSSDFIIGAPIYKQDIETEFINTILVLRNQCEEDATFKQILLMVSQTIVEATEHYNYPIELLPEKLSLPVSDGDFPLFDIVILLRNIHDKRYIQPIAPHILFSFLRADTYIEGRVEFDSLLYSSTTIERIFAHFTHLFQVALFNLDLHLSEIEILSEEEKRQLLVDFNNTTSAYPRDKTIPQLFEEQAVKTPDRIAVRVPNADIGVHSLETAQKERCAITYRQLNKKSNLLAHQLKEKGVGPNSIVGIMTQPSLEMIVGVLGILKAGGAYLPIDPHYPNERKQYMLKDSRVEVLVTTQNLSEEITFEKEIIYLDTQEKDKDKVEVKVKEGNINLSPQPQPESSKVSLNLSPENLAYVIYTSGTTGNPKGVMIDHRALVNYTWWAIANYIKKEPINFPLYTSLSFDLTVTSIFPPLLSGNTVVVYAEGQAEGVFLIEKIVEESRVGAVKVTPSHLKLIRNKTIETPAFGGIKRLIVGGEDLDTPLAADIFNNFKKNVEIYNEYGPTEATVGCMIHRFDPGNRSRPTVPIGIPAANVQIYLLDRKLRPLPHGVEGEIYISGDGIARGYMNQPQLTAEKFDPGFWDYQADQDKKEKAEGSHHSSLIIHHSALYRTGDLGRRLADGTIEFTGRIDQQVKIRGYRIELAEIESQLIKHPQIKEVTVADIIGKTGDKSLCAYFVPSGAPIPGKLELKRFLSQALPDHMIPAFFVPLDRIPLTANGKVDRRALPEPGINIGTEYEEGREYTYTYSAPRNQLEKKLVEIWHDVLGIHSSVSIGIDDNFFELGGHSLKATILISILHKELNVKVPLEQVFKRQSIRGLSKYIKDAGESKYKGVAAVEKKEYYAISPAQKRLYFLQQLDPESTSYNIPLVLPFGRDEDIDIDKLELILRRLIARHESLRTSFVKVDEIPYQKIHEGVEFKVEWLGDCSGASHSSNASIFIGEIINGFVRPFDLNHAPLLRAGLLSVESEDRLLLFDMHHIVTDETSQNILINEFMGLFNGTPFQLPFLQLQYKDYSEWLNQPEQQEMVKFQGIYWIQLLSSPGELPLLTLPLDFPRPEIQSFEGSSIHFMFNQEETNHLKEISKESDTTFYMTLLSIFTILLSKLSGLEDIIVGTPIAARRHADLEKIIGMFVNTLVIRSYPSGYKTFRAFLKEVRDQTLSAYENQEYPFEDLVEKILDRRDTSRNPVFDVMFTLIDQSDYPGDIREADGDIQFEYKNRTSKFDLNLTAVDLGEQLFFNFEYCTRLFKESTIYRMVEYFKKITQVVSVSKNRNLKLSDIEMTTDKEKRRLLFEFNDTNADFPADKTIHELFEEQVASAPDRIALMGPNTLHVGTNGRFIPSGTRTPDVHITYNALNEKSNQVAHLLREKGIKSDDIVGLMVERSIEMIVGILAVLKAGGAYLPIDVEYPAARKSYMLKDSAVKLLLTNYDYEDDTEMIPVFKGIEVIDLREKQLYHGDINNPEHMNNPSDLIYLIYTSGSTGKPKGVMLEHQNLVNLLIWGFRFTNLDFNSVLQFSTICFDVSFHEIFSTLLSGGRLVLIDKEKRTDIPKLFNLVESNQIKTLFLPISVLKIIFSEADYIQTFPTCVDHIQTAGEQVVISDRFRNYLKENNIYLHNHYGPAEAHVVTALTLDPEGEIPELPPIGKPVSNTVIYILDRYGNMQPIGVPGELFIGGIQVGRGYLGKVEATLEKFINDPFAAHDRMGNRMYRTGDLARWLPDDNGNIEFLGRIDHQVKIRGFRIEMGEIEAQMMKHDGIKEAVVIIREGPGTTPADSGEKYLCAYVVLANGEDAEENVSVLEENAIGTQLRDFLSQTLPRYMIPSFYVPIDKIPLMPNGKVDKKALPVPEIPIGEGYTTPRDEIEKKLVEIWSEVLGRESGSLHALIGIDNNFFELGGHSLKATSMISKIYKELNVNIPLAEVFKRQTVRALSKYIKDAKKMEYADIEAVEKKEYYALSSAQKRLYFLQQLDIESTSYNMPMVFPIGKDIDKDKIESTLKKLIMRHENLRTSFEKVNEGPVQRIHDHVEFEVKFYDLIKTQVEVEGEPDSASLHHSSLTIHHFIRPFDLTCAPLMRSGIFKHPDGHYSWVVDMHHIISDGTSHTILSEDFMTLYKGEALEPLRLHYKDFSQWQNGLFERGKIKTQEEYWLSLYQGEVPRLELPIDYTRPEVFTFEGDDYSFVLGREEALKLKALGSKQGATLFMTILAALNTLFYKYTGQTDIIIGSGIAGRPHVDLQYIVGMFVNTLAMRNYPEGEKTFESLLKEVSANSIKAFENQDVQFEELVEKLDPERNPSRNPLFDISMVVQNFRGIGEGGKGNTNFGQFEVLPLPEENAASIEYRNPISKFDMTFFVQESREDIYVSVEYYTGIFKEETIRRLASHFKNVIKAVIKQPFIKLKDIEVISPSEKNQLLYEFNDTVREIPGDKPLHLLFEEQVEKTPHHVAIVCDEGAFTYKALEERANQMAGYLHYQKEVQPGNDERIGAMLSQSLYCSVSIIGILKAGCAYVPLDPQLPEERIEYMIKDASIGIVISEKRYVKVLNRLQWECECFHSYLCVDSDNIYEEDEGERNELMDEELWLHVGETAEDDIAGGGWVSSYTGEPISRAEMDEYGENILKKLEPMLHQKMRVLEIGCASGISMYRIAPRVEFYYGTDLSRIIIKKNKEKVIQEGHQNIKLSCLPAHDIDKLGEGNFHLVIMNSVIQCFHGHNYLRKVIKKAIRALAEGGYLFIGDVMDQEKKDALTREMAAFKYDPANRDKGYTTKTDFSSELFLSRGFWKDLAFECEEIASVEFSDKIYTIKNELTEFRYDVLITINRESISQGVPHRKWKREKYQEDRRHLSGFGLGKVPLTIPSDNLAYIIYTSGSTGEPKGVEVEHRGVVNTLLCRKQAYGMNPSFVCLQLFAYGFDGFVTSFFTPLISGSKLVMPGKESIGDSEKIRDAIVRNRVTHFISVPPLYFAVIGMLDREEAASLRVVTLAGDKLTPNLLEMTVEKSDSLEITNEYGVTECSVMSTIYRNQQLDNRITIGRPIWNTRLYVLGPSLRLQPIGIPGELCITGDGVARGYLNQPELTAEKFNPDFQYEKEKIEGFHHSSLITHHSVLYRTGDLARWLSDGNIEFLGRIDYQVKIRGFRIEMGEIENQLLKHDLLKEVVVIDQANPGGAPVIEEEKYLYAYFVAVEKIAGTSDEKLSTTELRDFLSHTLPGYMVPAYFIQVDRIPLTPNGKIDRKALPAPEFTTGEEYTAPRNEIEKKLAEIWAEVLGRDSSSFQAPIGIHDNFFQMGGHSLKATILTSKIHKELNVKVPLAEVFKSQTIRELAEYIGASEDSETHKYAAIEAVEKREYYPLSSAQKRLYFLQQLDLESTSYNLPLILPLEKDIDKDKIESTLKRMIKRHENLRTSFEKVNEEPVQKIHKEVEFRIDVYDLTGAQVEAKVEVEGERDSSSLHHSSFSTHHFIRPFELSRAPLMRSGLIRLPDGYHAWIVDIHHVISDGTSHTILTEDFMGLYREEELTPLRLHYKDFSQWQNRLFKSDEIKVQEAYWLSVLQGEIPQLELPLDFKRPDVFTFEGDRYSITMERDDAVKFRALGSKHGATLYMNILAALNTLFFKYTGQTDIIIGSVIAGRPHADLQHIIGMFVNTLAMRNFPEGEKTYEAFLEEVADNCVNAFENQDVQFEELVGKLNLERDTSRNPLFDITMAGQNFRMPGEERLGRGNENSDQFEVLPLVDKGLPSIDYKNTTAKFDMTFFIQEVEDDVYIEIEYYTGIFKGETIRRLVSHFKNVINTVLHDASIKLKDIEMLSVAEKKQLFYEFNDTATDYPADKTIHQLFEEQVERAGHKVALVGSSYLVGTNGRFIDTTSATGNMSVTYDELNEKSNQLAQVLIEKGVQPDTIVGIMVERSVEMIIGILGILKAGGAYLPIAHDYPAERIDYMMTDSNARILVNDVSGVSKVGEVNELIDLTQFIGSTTQPLPTTPTQPLTPFHSSTQPCYVIYTSGSTGRPKGTLTTHSNAVRVVRNTNYLDITGEDRVLQLSNYAFDGSIFDIYGALLNGACLVMVRPGEVLEVNHLSSLIKREHVTVFFITTALFNALVDIKIDSFDRVRKVLFGGELVSLEHSRKALEYMGKDRIIHVYGPTETTVYASYYPINEIDEEARTIPIGAPISNTSMYILDKSLKVLPIMVTGEIYIGGEGVARGYLNNPEMTAEKFDQNYLNKSFLGGPGGELAAFFKKVPLAAGGRIYKTGDLGRWLPDGNIEFLGRVDNQVKVRGFRVELEEIEYQLSTHDQVKEAAILLRGKESEDKYLCAFVVPDTVEVEELKEYLSRRLPHYMVPALFVPLEKLPLTPNGKVDKKALALLGDVRRQTSATYITPETHLEKQIANAWKETLNLETVGLLDNFFDMGGNSINLLKVHSKLEKMLETKIPVVKLFEYPTTRSLAVYLRQHSEDQEEKSVKDDGLKLKDSVHPAEVGQGTDVAVIGMSAVFPGARNIHEFWENLKNGVESITFFTDEELVNAGTPPLQLEAPNYVRAKGVIEGAEYFDALFFDYTPREAGIMDPQVRLFHQCVWHALEDAGYNPFSYPQRIGLYAGATANMSWQVLNIISSKGQLASGLQTNLLENRDFMCTHISYKLNLKGPSFTVHTACSTSLVAIHLAVRGLVDRECEMALAGGVTISCPQNSGYLYEEGMIQSPDGHCRAFDADSKGLVGGNGAGVVLLKRYEDAQADGDHIYAIIKGSAINNDGLRKVGYSAPSVEGQVEVVRTAQVAARINPETITYIEAHGTGTELGDPVEMEALKIAFNTNKKRFCGIGSVKTNVGHLDCASGVAGFIKTVLAIKHRLIPPTLHFKAPNPKLGLDNSPFYVVTELTEWKKQENGSPLRAGVSSLGIGGTNAHVVLEESPDRVDSLARRTDTAHDAQRKYQLILLSAKTPTALEKITADLVDHFKEQPGIDLADAAYTLQVGRRSSQYRKMTMCSTVEEAVEALGSTFKRKSARTFLTREDNRSVIFVFSGQGSQYVNMGLDLYKTEPLFRDQMDRCFDILTSIMGYDLREILYPPATGNLPLAASTESINQTAIIQLLLFIFEYALAKLLITWGIKPFAMIGYSLGEYVAACISGVFSLEDALKLVAARGELIQETPQGAMLSVPLTEEDIKPLLNQHKELSLAIVNGPSCVAAGPIEAVDAFEKEMQKKRLLCTRINIAHAVHSQLMNPIRNKFEAKVKAVTLNKPRIPFISNVSGDWITLEEAKNPRYWGDQLCATVQFFEGIHQLMKEENAVFIEIGPGRVLSNIIRQHPHKKPGHMFVNLARHQQEDGSDDYFLLRAIGQLWLYGTGIDWTGFYSGEREKRSRIPLPTYPFEGKRYWIDDTIFRKIVELQAPDKGGANKVVEEERDTAARVEPQQPPPTLMAMAEGEYEHEYKEEYEAPRDELEQNIARVWQEFLGFEKIGIYDNFFNLNGDSLTATQLITRLKEIYPVDIALQDFFEEPTIAHLAQVVKTLLIEKIKNLSSEEKKSFLLGG